MDHPLILVDPLPRTLDLICDAPTRQKFESLGRIDAGGCAFYLSVHFRFRRCDIGEPGFSGAGAIGLGAKKCQPIADEPRGSCGFSGVH